MGRQGFISRTSTRQRNVDIHLSKGLCRHCSKKSIEGKSLCEYHSEYHRKYQIKRNNKLRAER